MAKIFSNIPLLDVENQDPITGLVSEGTYEGVPPTSFANVFSLECFITDLNGSGLYQNTGTVAVPVWTKIGAGQEIVNGSVTAEKLGANSVVLSKLKIVVKTVTVALGELQGTTANDPTCVGGQVLGYFPITNQDQFVTNVTLNVDGAVILGLLSAATAQNDFNVVILKVA